jgi:uncharacterized protein
MLDPEHSILKQTLCVSQILAKANDSAREFSKSTKINCKQGCGACCTRPNQVWATVGEMLPRAMKLFQEGEAENMLNRLENISSQSMCIMFQQDEKQPKNGRCSDYENRPLTCILFGSSTVHHRSERFHFLGCHWLKEHYEQLFDEQVPSSFKKEHDASLYSMMLKNSLENDSLKEEYPINEALERALKYILWIDYIMQLRDPILAEPTGSLDP